MRLGQDEFVRDDHARSGLPDRRPLRVDELPLAVLPNKDAGPPALLIYRAILVFSFSGGAIGHNGGIPVNADLDIIRNQPSKSTLPVLRSSRYYARFSTFPCGR